MLKKLTYQKDKLAKRLLLVAVVFSIFTISGQFAALSSIQQKAHQTELFVAGRVKEVERQVRFARPEFRSWTSAFISSNLLCKVKFNTSKRLSYGRKSVCFALHLLPPSRSLTVEDFMNV